MASTSVKSIAFMTLSPFTDSATISKKLWFGLKISPSLTVVCRSQLTRAPLPLSNYKKTTSTNGQMSRNSGGTHLYPLFLQSNGFIINVPQPSKRAACFDTILNLY